VEFNVKRLIIRASSLLKGLVLALIFSVFVQASLASASGVPVYLSLENYQTAIIVSEDGDIAGHYILASSFSIPTGVMDLPALTVFNSLSGILDGAGHTISGLTKPLFDIISGNVSDLNLASGTDESGVIGNGALANTLEASGIIDNVSFTGDVTGDTSVGGLVGYSEGTITNSSVIGDVTGYVGEELVISFVGGLVGYSEGTITNSYAVGDVVGIINDVEIDFKSVGGLVGYSEGTITNSYASGTVDGYANVGGLVGLQIDGTISNSYATVAVTGLSDDVGGLVGYSEGTITNSYATGLVGGDINVGGLVGESNGEIDNSYATGNVTGIDGVGGLVGESNGEINNSYAAGNVEAPDYVGGLVGYSTGDISNESYATGVVTGIDNFGGLVGYSNGTFGGVARTEGDFEDGSFDRSGPPLNLLSIVNYGVEGPLPFLVDPRINLGRPYLTSLIDSYDVVEEDTEETPSFNLRSYYTQAAKSLDKALISFGFKSNFSSHPNLDFQALEQNQSKLPAVIQLFEVSEYQNSNILLNKEDGLQLSISSYYKESVEIWTQGLDGEYLYLGLVEFDKDGQATLPALTFSTANTYQLLMIKAADKLSEKPNLQAQLGQITINVF
jgi:The GLUG motif